MRYDETTNSIRLPVRELCLLALRSGDLDLRPGARGIGLRRAAEGQTAHRLLQTRMTADGYEAATAREDTVTVGDLRVTLSGRADGVLRREIPVVEEIKTTNGRLDRRPSAFQEAQGVCYAWLLARTTDAETVEVRLTLYRQSDDRSETTVKLWRREDLENAALELLGRVRNAPNSDCRRRQPAGSHTPGCAKDRKRCWASATATSGTASACSRKRRPASEKPSPPSTRQCVHWARAAAIKFSI